MFGTTRTKRRLAVIAAVTAGAALAAAPPALAGNATGINVQLPTGYTISGKVTKSGGAALPNISVNAYGANGYGFAQTNTSGVYTIKGLAAGSYQVSFSGDYTLHLLGGYYTSSGTTHLTPTSGSATPVVVGPNKTGISVIETSGLAISGFVRNHSGQAVQGYGVSFYSTSGGGGYATTSSTGYYLAQGLAPGSYKAYLSAPSNNPSYLSGGYTGANSYHFTTSYTALQSFTLSASKSNFNFGVTTGYTVSGIIQTSGGAVMSGVDVSVGANGSIAGGDATTNSSGVYVVKGIPSGSAWKISIDPQSNYPTRMTGYYGTTNASHFVTSYANAASVTVAGANKNVGISKVPNGYTISGYVKNSAGNPIVSASVEARGADSQSSYTDGTGHYSIIGLDPGNYTVEVSAPYGQNYQDGYYNSAATTHFTIASGSASQVKVGPSAVLPLIKVPAGFTISGKITGPTAATAVADASLNATGTAGGGYAYTNSSGVYTIIGLHPGSYKISVSAPYGSALASGYYASNVATTHYTASSSSATGVTVG